MVIVQMPQEIYLHWVNGILKIKADLIIMNNIDLNKYKAKSIPVRTKVHEIEW